GYKLNPFALRKASDALSGRVTDCPELVEGRRVPRTVTLRRRVPVKLWDALLRANGGGNEPVRCANKRTAKGDEIPH
ncbi:MAG TPA: hypothetical protein VN259_10855, partial [Xanthomonadales bacterium]|nr:hypothetical protein [Xanthomonadales bacterium]